MTATFWFPTAPADDGFGNRKKNKKANGKQRQRIIS
jgi:hypothetical protein